MKLKLLILLVIICAACTGGELSKPTNTTADDLIAGVPTQPITGGNLVSMVCQKAQSTSEVLNSAIGCKIINAQKDIYYESDLEPKDTKVRIFTDESDFEVSIVYTNDKSDYTFIITEDQLASTDIEKIMSVGYRSSTKLGKLDLIAPLLNFLSYTTAKMDLYIKAHNDITDGNCSKQRPCRSISTAIAKIPYLIKHAVTINIAGSDQSYVTQNIEIRDKKISDTGSLSLIAKNSDFSADAQVEFKPIEEINSLGLMISDIDSTKRLLVKGFKFKNHRNGIIINSSNVNLVDVQLEVQSSGIIMNSGELRLNNLINLKSLGRSTDNWSHYGIRLENNSNLNIADQVSLKIEGFDIGIGLTKSNINDLTGENKSIIIKDSIQFGMRIADRSSGLIRKSNLELSNCGTSCIRVLQDSNFQYFLPSNDSHIKIGKLDQSNFNQGLLADASLNGTIIFDLTNANTDNQSKICKPNSSGASNPAFMVGLLSNQLFKIKPTSTGIFCSQAFLNIHTAAFFYANNNSCTNFTSIQQCLGQNQ